MNEKILSCFPLFFSFEQNKHRKIIVKLDKIFAVSSLDGLTVKSLVWTFQGMNIRLAKWFVLALPAAIF